MKKSFLVYAILILLSTPVCAKSVNVNNVNLNEIVLNPNQDYEENVQSYLVGMASNAEVSVSPDSLVDVKRTEAEKEKGIFSIFNLKGGVQKSPETTTNDATVEKTVLKQWVDGDYATGRWFGGRSLLEDKGLTINSSLLYSPSMKTAGGANGEASGKGYSLFNLGITLDTEKAGMWKGGTFYTLYQRKTGYGLSGANGNGAAMGDWMGYDGWDWRQLSQISECWYQQKLLNNKLRLKVGKQDANTDFGYLNSGWDFMNTALTVNPSTPMPTYPDQSFGFMAEINIKEWLSIRNGIYSRYNTPFNITELEVKPNIKNLPGRYMLGAWEMSDSNGYSTASGMDSTGLTTYTNFNRNYGCYAGFEQMVYKEKKNNENDMQGLVVFGQFGVSPSDKNDMNRYMGGGLHYVGLIPNRDKDKAGVAVASGSFASRLGNVGSDYLSRAGSETVVEAFYRAQITPWFYLQPDVQFIMNPGGCYESSVAIGLRSVVTF